MKRERTLSFCVKRGKSGTETYNLIQQVYSYETLSCARVLGWHKTSREGRETTEHDERSYCPPTMSTPENTERVRDL